MTDAQILDIAQRLNGKINVPLINETGEEKILIKIVKRVDRFLYDNLPNEFYDLIQSSNKGIDDDEARRLSTSLTNLANKHVNIPYLPEQAEFYLIRFVIAIFINAARRNWDLLKAEDEIEEKEFLGIKTLDGAKTAALIF